MAGNWQQKITDIALSWVSRLLIWRDSLLGVTRNLRRHPLAEDISFASGGRTLAAAYLRGEPGLPALLLCHGIGETAEHWSAAQALLRDHGVGSLVFNYSGYARSSGKIRARHCDEDFVAAYAELRRRAGTETPVYVLGFSLGSGIAAKGVSALHPPAAGLFLCEAFTSFADASRAAGLPSWIVNLLVPQLWETETTLPSTPVPVTIVHSTGDRLFPVSMAHRLVAATSHRADLVLVQGLAHNEPFLRAVPSYWEPILQRILPPQSAR
jgi:pimeloyl-ACP methyl ester carboxylesterase